MIKLTIPLIVLAFVGCASTDYTKYSETQVAIAQYKAESEKARYAVLAEIVKKGDPTASVAAIMSMQMGMGGNAQDQRLEAPRSSGDDALKWASLLIPSAVQGFGIYANARVATTQSNNATTTSLSTNSTFASIANTGSNNQASMASNANTAITGVAGSATTALSNMGNSSNIALTGMGNSSNIALTSMSNNANTALTSMANANAINVSTALTNQTTAYNSLITSDLNALNNAVNKLTLAPVVITNGIIQK
jgi:hypothetical protein